MEEEQKATARAQNETTLQAVRNGAARKASRNSEEVKSRVSSY